MSVDELLALRHEIAGLLHRVWNDDTGTLEFEDQADDDGVDWIDIRDVSSALDKYRDYDTPGHGWGPASAMTRDEYRFWSLMVQDQAPDDYGFGPVYQPLLMARCEVERPDCVTPYWSRPMTDEEMDTLDIDMEKIRNGDLDDIE